MHLISLKVFVDFLSLNQPISLSLSVALPILRHFGRVLLDPFGGFLRFLDVRLLLNVNRIWRGNVHRIRLWHFYGNSVKHGHFDRQWVRKWPIHLHWHWFLNVDGNLPFHYDRYFVLDCHRKWDPNRNGYVFFNFHRIRNWDIFRDGNLLELFVAPILVGFRRLGIEDVGRLDRFAGPVG